MYSIYDNIKSEANYTAISLQCREGLKRDFNASVLRFASMSKHYHFTNEESQYVLTILGRIARPVGIIARHSNKATTKILCRCLARVNDLCKMLSDIITEFYLDLSDSGWAALLNTVVALLFPLKCSITRDYGITATFMEFLQLPGRSVFMLEELL